MLKVHQESLGCIHLNVTSIDLVLLSGISKSINLLVIKEVKILAHSDLKWAGLHRECHGFTNPCGLVLRVTAGAGTGCEFATLTQPVPATQVDGSCGICRSV